MEIVNWPVVTGCFRISEGCASCPSYWEYEAAGKDYSPVPHEDRLGIPLITGEPKSYMVAFGSDLFQPGIPLEFYDKVFDVMNRSIHHNFQIITKRLELLLEISDRFDWTDNIYLGAPVELKKYEYRIDLLRKIPATFKFLSMTSLLGPMDDLDLSGIDAVGVVEEYWGYRRETEQEWYESVKRQCEEQGVEFSCNHRVYENGEAV